MNKIVSISKAWRAYFKDETSILVRERSEICQACPSAVVGTFEKFMPDKSLKNIQGLKCDVCHCPLSTKLRSKDQNESCPKGKW